MLNFEITEITELCEEDFSRSNENIHIHLSTDMPSLSEKIISCNYMQMICVVSGEATYEFEHADYVAKKGDLLFINADVPYRFTALNDGESFLCYNMMINNGVLTREPTVSYPHRLLAGSFAFYLLRDRENNPQIFFNFSKITNSTYGEFFNKMYLEYNEAKNGYRDVLMAYFTLITITATRQNEVIGNSNEKVYRNQAITFVQEYINRCYCDKNISASGLADLVYLDVDYLGRIFKKATGNSITEALQKKRIERVCHLLTTTDRAINDIADECGFTDMHFFYKVFKRRMNILPGQYREKTRN